MTLKSKSLLLASLCFVPSLEASRRDKNQDEIGVELSSIVKDVLKEESSGYYPESEKKESHYEKRYEKLNKVSKLNPMDSNSKVEKDNHVITVPPLKSNSIKRKQVSHIEPKSKQISNQDAIISSHSIQKMKPEGVRRNVISQALNSAFVKPYKGQDPKPDELVFYSSPLSHADIINRVRSKIKQDIEYLLIFENDVSLELKRGYTSDELMEILRLDIQKTLARTITVSKLGSTHFYHFEDQEFKEAFYRLRGKTKPKTKIYFNNVGQAVAKLSKVNDQKHGLCLYFYPGLKDQNGSPVIHTSVNYLKGKKFGPEIVYRKNGKLMEVLNYHEDKLHGVSLQYDHDNSPILRETYFQGQFVRDEVLNL